MNNQLRWLNFHKKEIYTKSKLLYNLYEIKNAGEPIIPSVLLLFQNKPLA